jgi:hypothetical protein
VELGKFWLKYEGFGAKNGAKTRVCSYYLINRVKMQDIDTMLVIGNLRVKNGLHRVGGVGVGWFFGEETEKMGRKTGAAIVRI